MSIQFPNYSQKFIFKRLPFDLFYPLRRLVDSIEVKDDKFAHFLCNLIPCTCPFERDVNDWIASTGVMIRRWSPCSEPAGRIPGVTNLNSWPSSLFSNED